jgi:hypothetical protein
MKAEKLLTLEEQDDSSYLGEDGTTMKREYGETPNGNNLNGSWVLRDSNGEWVDFNQYRNDLACHHNLDLRDQK